MLSPSQNNNDGEDGDDAHDRCARGGKHRQVDAGRPDVQAARPGRAGGATRRVARGGIRPPGRALAGDRHAGVDRIPARGRRCSPGRRCGGGLCVARPGGRRAGSALSAAGRGGGGAVNPVREPDRRGECPDPRHRRCAAGLCPASGDPATGADPRGRACGWCGGPGLGACVAVSRRAALADDRDSVRRAGARARGAERALGASVGIRRPSARGTD